MINLDNPSWFDQNPPPVATVTPPDQGGQNGQYPTPAPGMIWAVQPDGTVKQQPAPPANPQQDPNVSFDANGNASTTTPWATANTPASASSTGSGTQDFGNLSDPTAWMALVNDPAKLTAWIKQNNPGWSDQLVNYYAGVVKGQPGANAQEQAGSAQYYMGKFKEDPFYGGKGSTGMGAFGGTGSFAQPYGKDFTAPSAEDAKNTPGYQFMVDAGQKAIQNSAASKGTLLTGGTQQRLQQNAEGIASTTYGDTYNRAYQQYLDSYGMWRNTNNDIWGRYKDVSGGGVLNPAA